MDVSVLEMFCQMQKCVTRLMTADTSYCNDKCTDVTAGKTTNVAVLIVNLFSGKGPLNWRMENIFQLEF